MDDFGVQYVGKQHLNQLISALQAQYKITVDLTGSSYLGLTIEWDYTARHVDISMPDYVRKALHKFQHPAPKRPTHSPSKWTAPIYGAQIQYAPKIDDSKPLDASGINHVQRFVSKLL